MVPAGVIRPLWGVAGRLPLMILIVVLLLGVVTPASGQTCDNGKGYCIDANSESCTGGSLKPGYCPGASNIICCEHPSCDSGRGQCINADKRGCTDGVLKPGYCPGASNIVCCEESNLPAECSNGGPPLLEGSYEFTLKNQGMYR
jgi:hypothetical protein